MTIHKLLNAKRMMGFGLVLHKGISLRAKRPNGGGGSIIHQNVVTYFMNSPLLLDKGNEKDAKIQKLIIKSSWREREITIMGITNQECMISALQSVCDVSEHSVEMWSQCQVVLIAEFNLLL